MKYYLLAITLLLTNCAVASLIPMPVNCETLECSESEYCLEYYDTAVCVPLGRPLGYCDIPCLDNQECRFGACLTSNPDGSVCEFDTECTDVEFCITGRCTSAPCIPGEVESCYSGLVSTAGIGECRSGFYICTEDFVFTQECIGEVTPVPDEGYLACNGEDNNCDGVSDPAQVEAIDIIFALDLSGSMREENIACARAIQQTANLYNHANVKMGLITFPTQTNTQNDDPEIHVAIPLVNYNEFTQSIVFEMFLLNSTIGEEPSYDVVWRLANNIFPEIVRTPNSKLAIILFTDEEGQSYMDPPINEEEVCEAIDDVDINLYVVTYPNETYRLYGDELREWENIPFREGWDDCASILELNDNENQIVEQLREIAESTCI